MGCLGFFHTGWNFVDAIFSLRLNDYILYVSYRTVLGSDSFASHFLRITEFDYMLLFPEIIKIEVNAFMVFC